MTLPTNRTQANTPAEHANDHNVLHALHNTLEGSTVPSTVTSAQVAAKAADSAVLHKTGNETKSGVLTFDDSPIVPTATTAGQAVNKGQLDSAVSGVGGTLLSAAGGVDDTALVVAGRVAAGIGGTLVFTSGTYVVSGLTASVAGQHWIIWPGATIKLKNAANTPVIDVTAGGVTIEGGGTIDGNRANQTATAALDAVQGNTAGIRAVTVDKLKVKDLLIKDTGVGGIFADNVTNLQVRNNHFAGCGQSGNYKVVMVYFTVGSSTGVRISGNVIDGSTRGNGCIGISLNAASRIVSRLRITGNECIVGNAGATATLGIELFTGSGAAIRDAVVANNVVIGTAGSAPYNVYGISVGGTTTGAALGCSNVAVTGNTVRDCNLCAIELVGSGVTCSGNTTYNSGFVSVAAASPMTGGLRASTVIGNTLLDTVGAAYAIHVSGNTDGLNGCVVSGNVIHNPEGAAIGVDGVVTRLVVADNVVTAASGPGFYTDGSADLTDSTVSGNTFDLTGSPADQDGILLASTGIAGLKIIGNTITGASRYGIYGLVATTAVEVIDNTVTGCDQGLRTDDDAVSWIVAGNHIHDNTDRGIIFFAAATDLLEYGNAVYSNPGGDYYHDAGTTFADFVVAGQAVTIP